MRKLLSLLCVAAAGMVLLCCCHADAQPLPCKRLTLEDLKGVKHVPDELLVQFKPGSNEQKIAKALAKGKAQKLERLRVDADGELHVVKLRGKGVADAIRDMGADEDVACVEPNLLFEHAQVTEATYTNGSLWGMHGSATSKPNPFGSNAGSAWSSGLWGSSAIHIGIIDQGIQVTHPDLAASMWVNPHEQADGLDNDGTGYADDFNGWDFLNNDKTVYDAGGDNHGTHVAGTIGAVHNGAGVLGVAPLVKMIGAKFLSTSGGSSANAIKALDYFSTLKVKKGLRLVASSNSWTGSSVYSSLMAAAITRSGNNGTLFIVAAGNTANNNDALPIYPCSYNLPNVICVAAIDKAGNLASFSNYGATLVHLAAPGVDIMSTVANGYASYSGTSMATPHVTGAVALYAAKYPAATAPQIKRALLASAQPTASLAGKTLTGGRLDIARFLATAPA